MFQPTRVIEFPRDHMLRQVSIHGPELCNEAIDGDRLAAEILFETALMATQLLEIVARCRPTVLENVGASGLEAPVIYRDASESTKRIRERARVMGIRKSIQSRHPPSAPTVLAGAVFEALVKWTKESKDSSSLYGEENRRNRLEELLQLQCLLASLQGPAKQAELMTEIRTRTFKMANRPMLLAELNAIPLKEFPLRNNEERKAWIEASWLIFSSVFSESPSTCKDAVLFEKEVAKSADYARKKPDEYIRDRFKDALVARIQLQS